MALFFSLFPRYDSGIPRYIALRSHDELDIPCRAQKGREYVGFTSIEHGEYLMFPFRLAAVSIGITLILCGVATWDMLSTFWFDWQIITGKRKWKWPMVRRASTGFHRTVLIFYSSDRL